jgi:hypothetical protein
VQSLRCSDGRRFLATARDQEVLEKYLETSIASIKRLLCPSAKAILSTSQRTLNALRGTRFSVPNRVYEVRKCIWHLNFRPGHGVYDNGKIFLKEDNWCRKTLYHEALHSLSRFSLPAMSSLGHRHLLFSEGLTEFFAGYVLFRNHKTCFESWRRGTFEECRLSSYKSKVKLWCTFCNFIKIGEVAKLYFWTGSGSWNETYTQFLKAIHNAGYPSFRDIIDLGNNSEMLFTDECINVFGRDFQEILNSRKSLDYGLVRI